MASSTSGIGPNAFSFPLTSTATTSSAPASSTPAAAPAKVADGFTPATSTAAARGALGTKQQQVDALLKQLSDIQPGTPRWDELKEFAGDASPQQIQAEIGKYRAKAQELLLHSSNLQPSEFESLLHVFDSGFKANLSVQGALYDVQDISDPSSKQFKALSMWCDDPVEMGVAADDYKAKVNDLQKQMDQGKISPDELKAKLKDAVAAFHADLMIRKGFGMKAFQERLKKELEDLEPTPDTSF